MGTNCEPAHAFKDSFKHNVSLHGDSIITVKTFDSLAVKYKKSVSCLYNAESFLLCCNDSIFSDRQVWANSVDPDQTDWAGSSGSTLFAIPSASFAHTSLWQKT